MKKLLSLFLLLRTLQVSAQYFPSYSVNVCTNASKGYYFMDAFSVSVTQNPFVPTEMIMDSTGQIIYYRRVPNGGSDFKMQQNGLMSYTKGNYFYLLDSTFTLVDSFACQNGVQTDAHDFQLMSNGDYLMLGYENQTMNLNPYFIFGVNHNLMGSNNANVKCAVIQEQDVNHNVVFEWHAKDHFNFMDVDTNWMISPINVDWTHSNAVAEDADGNFLLSSRHLNEITKINRGDSSVMWRMGGNANQFTFTNDPLMFKGQHDIRRLANGHITLWDNGRNTPTFHVASAKEYAIDEVNHTATLVWNFVEDPNSYSQFVGNTQRLPNGNTLIDFGNTTTQPRLFDVVDSTGNTVFELQFADTLRSYRVFNYLTMPWKLPRAQIGCVHIGNQYFLDAGSGYSSYLWSTGDTTQMIPVTAADTFTVMLPDAIGGFMRSEDFIVTDTANPCNLSGMEIVTNANSIRTFPNPVKDELHIELGNNTSVQTKIEIFNTMGELISSTMIQKDESSFTLGTADLPNGIYLIRIGNCVQKFIKSE